MNGNTADRGGTRELPLPEEGPKDEAISPEKLSEAEAETVEVICRGRRRGRKLAAKFTDEELEAQALAAQAAERGGDGCSACGRRRRWKRSRSGTGKTD
ncbi:hypothetical protein KCP71_08055 [Salmonella enterica subsp. enterica]|nr:hypothetical protein KCP71_08055 [Salmonella enterica subsp. enterica]